MMVRDWTPADELVDQVAAATGRVRLSKPIAAIVGRRRAAAAIDEHHLPAPHRSPHRMLRYLAVVLVWLAGYTGLLYLGWAHAAGWMLGGLVLVLGGIAWLEHRHAPPDPDEVPQHVGFADDPAELEQQLAELRPWGPFHDRDGEILPEYAAAKAATDSATAAACACAARWDAAVAETLALFDELEVIEHAAFDELEQQLADRLATARRRFGIGAGS